MHYQLKHCVHDADGKGTEALDAASGELTHKNAR